MKPNKTPRKHAAFASSSRQMKRRPKVKSLLAVLVAFCTVCALTMPAATLEGQAQASCGLAEHTHDESCYESVLVCGQEESEGHVHDESCYEEVLTCEIPEHTHSEACWVQSETQAEAGNEENSEAVTEDGAGSDMEAAAGTETGTDTEADTGTGTGTDSSENGDAAEAGSETDSSGNAGTGAGDNGSAEAGAESGDGQTENGGAGSEADGTAENGSGTENAGEQGESASAEDALTEADKTEQAENPQAAEEAAEMPDGATVPEGYTEQYTVRDEENGFAVTVYAPEGVVPEGAVLSAELLSEETEEYVAAEQELAAETEAVMAENGVSALSEDGADAASEDGEAAAPSYGFAALDIHFEDENGEEVEPNGDVYVVIDAAGLLPEDADPESVTVQHHAEQEDGSVAVETVADTADATNGVVAVVENEAQAENDVQAAFEVDGFSTFTITWSGRRTTYFQVTVHYVDASGTEIQGTRTAGDSISNNDTIIFADYADIIEGYNYSEAHYGNSEGNVVTYMTATEETAGSWPFQSTVRYLRFYNESGTQIAELSHDRNSSTQSTDIYLVYTVDAPAELYITDTISEDGLFNAEFGSDITIPEDATVEYTWYRSLTGADGSWSEVVLQRVTGTQDNIVNNGRSVNVAYDSIAANAEDEDRYWYYVTAVVTDSRGGTTTYTSEPLQVPYYIELQNGSFESPVADYWNNQVSNGTEGLIWQTTGEGTGTHAGADVEIVRSTNESFWDSSDWQWKTYQEKVQEIYSPSKAADGVQFAELNCEAYGALYQDVLTVPGVELNWYLEHCARQGNDTMALVIMPTTEAESLTTRLEDIANSNADNQQKAQQIEAALDAVSDDPGVQVQYFKDGTKNWEYYSGTYDVADGQYLTRFFFVAVSTGSNDATVGNLLDHVGFGKDVPEPQPDEGQLTVTKVVEGYTLDSDYSVTVNIDGDGEERDESYTFERENFTYNSVTGTYSASHTFYIGEMTAHSSENFTVTETVAGAPAGYTESSSVKTGDDEAQPGTSTIVLVDAGTTKNVTFTNTYVRTTGSLTISKNVSGVNVEDVTYRDYIFNVTAGDDVTDTLPSNFTDGTATVTITGAASKTLTGLPAGTYTVVEQDVSKTDISVNGVKYQFDGVAYSGGTGTDSNEVTVSAGGTAEIIATNSYRQVVDIVIEKVDGDGKELAGAEFQLTNADGKYYFYDLVTGTGWSDTPTTFAADIEDDNIFTLHDLPDGTYTLTETKAPDGYQLLTSNITITVNEGTVIASGAGAEYESGTITVTNITGTELPETGGPGTTILTIGGLLLMAGAVGGGYGLRRRRGKEGR